MIEKFYFELIIILFPDKFASLDEMSDDPYSSCFQYPIYFMKESFYIFDMFKDKKTGCEIKGFIIEGEWLLQIADDFLYFACIVGMSAQEFFCNITGDISLRLQRSEVFEQPAVTSSQVYQWNMFLSGKIFNKNTFVETIKVFVVLSVLISYGVVARLRIVDKDMFLVVRQTGWLID